MPRGDGTGPMGYGPMTGRALGYCAGYGVPGYANPGFGPRAWYGRGRGRGLGYGRGLGLGYGRAYRWGCVPPYPAYGYFPAGVVDDREALRREADYLKGQIDALSGRLAEIDETLKKMSKSEDAGPKGGPDTE